MNKSLATNCVAAAILLVSFFVPSYQGLLFNIGAFALSGSLTNNLAVHMLFEKVPFLYGSGVIQNNFEQFKSAIKELIIKEFFNRENIAKLISKTGNEVERTLSSMINSDQIFEEFLDAIQSSKLGGMLAMVGGNQALEPLREPISKKFLKLLNEVEIQLKESSASLTDNDNLFAEAEQLIDTRLDELTPDYVKDIVAKMIQRHLGWLVVWGGVIGGGVGIVVSIIR